MRRFHAHAQQLSAAEPRSAGSVGYKRWFEARGYPLDPLSLIHLYEKTSFQTIPLTNNKLC
jgi:hypothetical protein